jgi:hypothetical protein
VFRVRRQASCVAHIPAVVTSSNLDHFIFYSILCTRGHRYLHLYALAQPHRYNTSWTLHECCRAAASADSHLNLHDPRRMLLKSSTAYPSVGTGSECIPIPTKPVWVFLTNPR